MSARFSSFNGYLSLAALILPALSAESAPAAQVDVIAYSGQPAPDGNGYLSGHFSYPVLNNSGHVSFLSQLGGTSGGGSDNFGVFHYNGAVRQIARKGQTAPDGNGYYFNFAEPAINDVGQTAFYAAFAGTSGGGDDSEGILRTNGVTPILIARRGQPAPDGNGILYEIGDPFYVNSALNNSGEVAFAGGLVETAGLHDDTGVFLGNGGPVQQILRAGTAAPNFTGYFNGFGSPALNDSGQAAFQVHIEDDVNSDGIFLDGIGHPLRQIARMGQAAPGGNGRFQNVSSPAINEQGLVAFHAALSGTSGGAGDDSGIYLGDGNSVTQVAREGQPAPDGNGTFGYVGTTVFGAPAINDAGQAAFFATVRGTTGGTFDDHGVFRGDGVSLTRIARAGQATPSGVGVFDTFSEISLNNAGQTAFSSILAGTSGQTEAIFLYDDTHGIQEVVREGDFLLGTNITSLGLARGVAHRGAERSGLNDLGQVAYTFALADGRSGVALWTSDLSTAGDFTYDGTVDGFDLLAWQRGASPSSTSNVDLNSWGGNYGVSGGGAVEFASAPVPEPTTALLVACATGLLSTRRRNSRGR